ncbi:MAG: ComF family protein [Wenzhouxiangella sp.]
MGLDGLRRIVFPPVCLVCGQDGQPAIDCCSGCEAELPVPAGQCACCGLELDRDVALCGRCAMATPAFTATWPGFVYRDEIERLVRRFKFHADLAAGRLLADLLARRLAAAGAPRPDLVIPVPLHRRRLLARGYNQSALLCRDLAARIPGLSWLDALERVRHTARQAELPAERRGGNVRDAFRVARLPGPPRFVALVDDVMTTGATLDECARVLRLAGVERVDIWVAARA